MNSCNQANIQFVPLIFETFGSWHKDAQDELKRLCRLLNTYRGFNYKTTYKYWTRYISFQLMRFHSQCLLKQIDKIVYSNDSVNLDIYNV